MGGSMKARSWLAAGCVSLLIWAAAVLAAGAMIGRA